MLVGIVGKARSGKDTFSGYLADALFEETGKTFVLMAYATELKRRCQEDFDLSYGQLWGNEKEVEDKRYIKAYATTTGSPSQPQPIYWTPREIMQAYGQFFRTIKYNFWVDCLFNVINEKEYENIIITDVRHPNEAEPIKERGGYLVKVKRDVKEEVHGQHHISETAMDGYEVDFTVVNNWGKQELLNSAAEVAKVMLSLIDIK